MWLMCSTVRHSLTVKPRDFISRSWIAVLQSPLCTPCCFVCRLPHCISPSSCQHYPAQLVAITRKETWRRSFLLKLKQRMRLQGHAHMYMLHENFSLPEVIVCSSRLAFLVMRGKCQISRLEGSGPYTCSKPTSALCQPPVC